MPLDYVEDAAGCWIWQRAFQSRGYGHKWCPRRKRLVLAHRLAWEERNGEIPKGLVIDHLCRVRACVNPDHLEAVTQAENVRRGTKTSLTPEKVAEIREAQGTLRELAERFGLSKQGVSHIRRRTRWA